MARRYRRLGPQQHDSDGAKADQPAAPPTWLARRQNVDRHLAAKAFAPVYVASARLNARTTTLTQSGQLTAFSLCL